MYRLKPRPPILRWTPGHLEMVLVLEMLRRILRCATLRCGENTPLRYDFTMVQLENRPFNPEEVWHCAIHRLKVRLNALAFKVKRRATQRSGQDLQLYSPEAENRRMNPRPWLQSACGASSTTPQN